MSQGYIHYLMLKHDSPQMKSNNKSIIKSKKFDKIRKEVLSLTGQNWIRRNLNKREDLQTFRP